MRNLKKRVTALVLSLLLTISYLPLSAIAAVESNGELNNKSTVLNNDQAAPINNKGLIKDDSVNYNLYYFLNDDGSRALLEWREVKGAKYFFDHMGYSVNGWYVINGVKYYFDDECRAVSGTRIIRGQVYSFDDNGKQLSTVTQGLHIDPATKKYFYILDDKGTLAKSSWQTNDNQGYYFDDKGFAVTDKQTIDGDIYLFNEYKLTQDLCTDEETKQMFFIINAKGERLRSAWSADKNYYFDAKGFAVKGWVGIEGAQYYFKDDFTPIRDKTDEEIDGKKFTFDAEGKLVSDVKLGLQGEGDKQIYVVNASGLLAKEQWQVAGDAAYYFGADTFAVDGNQEIGTAKEQFVFENYKLKLGLIKYNEDTVFYIKDTTAARIKSDFVQDGNAKYYFNEIGNAVKGWQTIGEYKYYFDDSYIAAIGSKEIEGKQYTFDDQGRLISQAALGLNWDAALGYYTFVKNNLGVIAKNEWQKVDNAAYYFDNDGHSVTGKHIIGGEVFTFDTQHKLITGISVDPDNKNVFFIENLDGTRVRGKWYTVDNAKYYFNDKGYALKGRQQIDGLIYMFDTDAKLQIGLCMDPLAGGGPRPFYIKGLDGTRAIDEWVGTGEDKTYLSYNGFGARDWYYINGDPHYFNNGKPVTGTHLIDGKVYTLDKDGKVTNAVAQTGILLDDKAPGGSKYYYIAPNTNAPAKNTWYKDDKKAYYFGADGYSVAGRQEIAGSVYNFDEKFELITGLNTDNDKLFYIKDLSAMRAKSEWVAIGNDGYYFGSDGYALKGRQVIGNDLYIFADDYKVKQGYQADPNDASKIFIVKDAVGTRAKNEWYTNENAKKLYFGADGYAAKGWLGIDGDTYYFDGNFNPLTGPQTIEGKEYKFGDDGKLADAVKIGLQLDEKTKRYKFILSPVGTFAVSSWQIINSEAYYFDAEGLSVKGRQVIEEKVYFFTDEFKLKLGLYIDEASAGGKTAFFINDNTGARATSEWKIINENRYYFDSNALAVTGRRVVDETVLVFNDDFTLKTGLIEDTTPEGNKKAFYVSPKTGLYEKALWVSAKSAYYYIGADGYAVTGPQKIDGITYIFTADFTLQTGLYKDPNSGNSYRYIAPYTRTIHKGWLTLDSKKYYFDFLGLAVTGAYYIDGTLYQFNNDAQLIEHSIVGSKGIDVSSFQGVIDWAAVKSDGIEYAIIRAVHWPKGGSYYQIDPYFYRNVMGAKAQGIKVGAYIYSYAFTYAEGVEEASFFVNSNEVKTLKANGVKFDLPIFMDYEDNKIIDKQPSKAERTNAIRGGMVALDQNGYYPGFYMNHNWATNYVDTNALIQEGYAFWLAHFNIAMHKWGDKPGLWQYSSTGRVSGISGNVDMNVMYKNYPSIINPGGGGNGNTGGGGTPSTGQLTVYDLNTKTYITDNWNTIVAGIVQNEVGSGLSATGLDAYNLYKAQAVAARSWLLFQKQASTANPQVGIKAPRVEVVNAVAETQHQVLKYGGAYVNAAYGAASAAITNSSANMGWGSYPYLTHVDTSAYEPSGYINETRTLDEKRMRETAVKLGVTIPQGLPTTQWLTDIQYDARGYCTSITFAGKKMSGGKFYENCYGLLSPNFKLTNNGSGGNWTFNTSGFGHCVGMSQWGARNMIVRGVSYTKVLETYYPGAQVTTK